jgi:hypothetical protein
MTELIDTSSKQPDTEGIMSVSNSNSAHACATRRLFYLSDVLLRAIQTIATVAPDKVGATFIIGGMGNIYLINSYE